MVPAPLYYPSSDSIALQASAPSISIQFNHDLRRTSSASTTNARTCVCIVGVGFVGESLLREFGSVFQCIGYDISPDRVKELTPLFDSLKKVSLTSDERALARATHYLISVPTLLRPDRSVNLDFVKVAIRTVLNYAKPGACIVIESSVCVGTTRGILAPYKDIFHCGMSPERVDPGRSFPTPDKIPKIISGLTPRALKTINMLYSKVFETLVPVSKPEVAEMTKLFENCYRMINIAYVNEMSDACRAHGVDPHEMIGAAATKPYGFQAFYPGLGVGGHCIPVNPFYLLANNKNLPVLERATKLMWSRPVKLANKFHRRCLLEASQNSSNVLPRILVVGVGFKPGESVLSCSPGLSFAQTLREAGCARLAFYDPLVPQRKVTWMEKLSDGQWSSTYIDQEFDGLAICNIQRGVDFEIPERLQRTFVRRFV